MSAIDALCRTSFAAFAWRSFRELEPGTEYTHNWHLDCMAEHLEANLRGDLPWLIINIPPRMLKSVNVAQQWPAWVMGNDPSHQFIGASYAHTLAERNVMKTRHLITGDWYRGLFKDTLISTDQNQKDYFTTTKAGQYKGTGINGTVTGFGCHTLLVDDPINPKEALSDTVRKSAIESIRSTLFSRFNDRQKAKFIMIMQRVHDGDPTGDLMKDERFHLLKLPAVATKPIFIDMNGKHWEMKEGEYLSPRLGEKDLDELRMDLGEYHFAGQYLQEPVPVGGGEFKPEWIQYYRKVKPEQMNIYILCDAAGGDEVNKKKKKTSDFSTFMVIGLGPDGNNYLLDAVRDRLNPTERVDTLFVLHKKWRKLSGKPPKVGYEKYGIMTDTHYIKLKQEQDNYRFALVELGGKMAKEERIRRMIPDLQRGMWFFPESLPYLDTEGRVFDLMRELVDSEMASFPRARFDDMLDAISRRYDKELSPIFPELKVKAEYHHDDAEDDFTKW